MHFPFSSCHMSALLMFTRISPSHPSDSLPVFMLDILDPPACTLMAKQPWRPASGRPLQLGHVPSRQPCVNRQPKLSYSQSCIRLSQPNALPQLYCVGIALTMLKECTLAVAATASCRTRLHWVPSNAMAGCAWFDLQLWGASEYLYLRHATRRTARFQAGIGPPCAPCPTSVGLPRLPPATAEPKQVVPQVPRLKSRSNRLHTLLFRQISRSRVAMQQQPAVSRRAVPCCASSVARSVGTPPD